MDLQINGFYKKVRTVPSCAHILKVPSSKSLTHRALFCAALAKGRSIIINPSKCDDTLASVHVLSELGIAIKMDEKEWIVNGGTFKKPLDPLDCNESGTTFRFVTALTDILEIPCEIVGKPSLMMRPQRPDAKISSQYLSGLLLADPSISIPEDAVSKPYIALTLEMQKKFENGPAEVAIEGCWSSAAFLIALGTLVKSIQLKGLNRESLQADKMIVTILKEMGADIEWQDNTLSVKPSPLKAVSWDLTDTPDLYPILSVVACFAKGQCQFSGIERLQYKESDRTKPVTWCHALGDKNTLIVDSNDHRIIMAAAVWAKAKGQKLEFRYPEAVAKSWPDFWKTWETL